MVGSVETFGVAVGGIAGLLIVNVLPKEQYAIYTFLVACMTLVLGVTDFGLAHCCMPIVGQRNREVHWVVGVCRQVFRKRWLLLGLGLALVGPYWFYTARQHGWSGGGFYLSSALILFVVLLALREYYASTLLVVLGHIATLNRVALASHSMRLVLVSTVLLLLPITAWSMAGVVAATAAASLVTVTLYRKALKKHAVASTELDPADAKHVDAEVLRIAKPLVLPAIFYQIQGVVTVFLVSLFGTSSMLAEIGAFGRLAMVLLVVDRVSAVLLFPAIARAPAGPRLRKIVVLAHMGYLLIMALVLLSSVVFPHYWIVLLGEQYRSMEPLVWMVFLTSILGNASGFAFSTLAGRGVTVGQGYGIPLTLATQVAYLWIVGVSDLRSVLGFGVATSLAGFLYQYAILVYRWRDWRG